MKRIVYFIVVLNCFINISQAQIKLGGIAGQHIYNSFHLSHEPILGISSLMRLNPKIILSIEYQNFSLIERRGSEYSSSHIAVLFLAK